MHSLDEVHGSNALSAGRVRLSACFNSKPTGQIKMKFDAVVIPKETTSRSYY
jgi:hypothetical protein